MVDSATIHYTAELAGMYEPTNNMFSVPVNKKTGEAWTIGQLVHVALTPDAYEVAIAGSVGKFAMAVKSALAADATGWVVKGNADFVYLTAGGVIKPHNKVKAAAGGTVVEFVEGTDAVGLEVGEYFGLGTQGDGETRAGDSANGSVVRIRVNHGNW